MIGALYLCISVPNVCSSIIVGKLTDILVRILLASFPGLKRLGTCLPGLGQNVSCIICDFLKFKFYFAITYIVYNVNLFTKTNQVGDYNK